METRTITIMDSRTDAVTTVETSATTLGELKSALSSSGIDYEGLEFIEAITQTVLLKNETPLPVDVVYNGETTNNLIFYLNRPKDKHASGAGRRAELYSKVNEYGLAPKIYREEGVSFTNCPNSILEDYVEEYEESHGEEEEEESVEPTPAPKEKHIMELSDIERAIVMKHREMVSFAKACGIDIEEWLKTPAKPENNSPYSDAELQALKAKIHSEEE